MGQWVGKYADELVAAYGAPTMEYRTSDGGRVLTWQSYYKGSSGCTENYVVGPDNIVKKFGYSNCESFIIERPF